MCPVMDLLTWARTLWR